MTPWSSTVQKLWGRFVAWRHGGVRRVVVGNRGRGGTVVYLDAGVHIQFEFEFGGGDCLAIIYVPNALEWVSQTQTPLARRDEILNFVAERVQRDHAHSSYYQICADYINFYTR